MTTSQEREPLDPAAIMAAHHPSRKHYCNTDRDHRGRDGGPLCLPYRLAEANTVLAEQVRVVGAERARLAAELAAMRERTEGDPSSVYAEAAQLRAELAAMRERVEGLPEQWTAEAADYEAGYNSPKVSVSEAHEYPVLMRQAREHAAELRAALAGEPAAEQPQVERGEA